MQIARCLQRWDALAADYQLLNFCIRNKIMSYFLSYANK